MTLPVRDMKDQSELVDASGNKVKEWDATVISAFSRFLNTIPKVGSALIGALGFGYLLGWLRARAYFSTFGADWLLSEMSSSSLLGFSFFPVAFLSFLVIAQLSDLATDRRSPLRQLNIFKWATIIWMIFSVACMTADIFLGEFTAGFKRLNASMQMVAYMTFAIVMLGSLLLRIERQGKWDSKLLWTSFLIAYLGLYYAPQQLGKADAMRDTNPKTTQLPAIYNKKGEKLGWNLLLSNRDVV
ncbi:MAG: hypothetical protein KDD62_05555, partial [Bdellovibrionales bacterium]|nr:hypothetical protein [Bdellovibrionales bacterium]